MKEIFKLSANFRGERPLMNHSPAWWAEKMREEAEEVVEATSNDPTPEQRARMESEGTDALLSYVGYMESLGIGWIGAIRLAVQKIDELSERYPRELFDGSNGLSYEDNYRLARPDKFPEVDIFNDSVSLGEDPRLKVD